jgi:hypothetical protein
LTVTPATEPLASRTHTWKAFGDYFEAPLAIVVQDLHGVAVGAEHVGAVAAEVVDRPLAGWPVVTVPASVRAAWKASTVASLSVDAHLLRAVVAQLLGPKP